MMASIRILLIFAISLVMVGCLPHYYSNRHRHPDYYSNYHYSYAKEPSYSQPAGRWVRLVECIGPRTFCSFPAGSREQATCVEVEEECWEGGYTWKLAEEEGAEDTEDVVEKLNEEVDEVMEVELDLEDTQEGAEPDIEAVEPDIEAVEADIEAVEPDIEAVEAV